MNIVLCHIFSFSFSPVFRFVSSAKSELEECSRKYKIFEEDEPVVYNRGSHGINIVWDIVNVNRSIYGGSDSVSFDDKIAARLFERGDYFFDPEEHHKKKY